MEDMDEDTLRVVDEVFISLQGIFPAFKQAWPTQFEMDEAKYQWVIAFIESGINNLSKISIGISRCRKMDVPFVPSCGQFIEMCRPSVEDMGIPLVNKAYKEACENSHPSAKNKKWSHIVVHHAWRECGAHNLATWNQHQSRPLFEKNYDTACRLFLNGCELHKIQEYLPCPSNVIRMNKAVGIEALRQIKSILGEEICRS